MKKRSLVLLILLLLCLLFTGCSGAVSGENTGQGHITISIRCDTAIANGLNTQDKWKGVLPDDGCILSDTTVDLPKNSTVFDALCIVRDECGVQMEYSGGRKTAYIEGIGNLYERDGGRWSGWMYSVNGEYPDIGCGAYVLKDGDYVQWNYTCDLGADLNASSDSAEKWKEEHE